MKRKLFSVLPFIGALLFMTSCAYDKDNNNTYYPIDWGVVTMYTSTEDYEIVRDDGAVLWVTKSPSYNLEEGKRVRFQYDIINKVDAPGKDHDIYQVEVLGFMNILSKPVVYQSFINENFDHRNDSIGNDALSIYYAALSGEYINVRYNYVADIDIHGNEKPREHMISMTYDDIDNQDTIRLTLHHKILLPIPKSSANRYNSDGDDDNDNGKDEDYEEFTDEIYETRDGIASFRVSDLLPEGKTTMVVQLKWNWDPDYKMKLHKGHRFWSAGIYPPGSTAEDLERGDDIILPPDPDKDKDKETETNS